MSGGNPVSVARTAHVRGCFRGLVLCCIACLTGVAGIVAWMIATPRSPGTAHEVHVRPGTTFSELARDLDEGGFLPRGHKPLVLLARFHGTDRTLRAGRYRIPRPASATAVLAALTTPLPEGVAVTIPEGTICADIGPLLEQAGILRAHDFAAACEDAGLAQSLGLPVARLEGYLFPDTYILVPGFTAADVARIMHRRFLEVWNDVIDSTSPALAVHGLHGMVTLASIVEREAAVRDESPRIAAVFLSRLRQGIQLGADPTVRYATGRFTGSLRRSDLDIASPYNTRRFVGLPPGPIANPGRKALRSVFAPEPDSGYLYFVGMDDGSRRHWFSRTLAEHNRRKLDAARNRIVSGIAPP